MLYSESALLDLRVSIDFSEEVALRKGCVVLDLNPRKELFKAPSKKI
jgi:hypothetical protein